MVYDLTHYPAASKRHGSEEFRRATGIEGSIYVMYEYGERDEDEPLDRNGISWCRVWIEDKEEADDPPGRRNGLSRAERDVMRKHEDMLKSGKVSIWVGDIDSEDALLSYVDTEGFGSDFDFQVDTRFEREVRAEAQPVALEHLVPGFSWWILFGKAVVERGKELGLTRANCMVAVYAFEYMPSPRINRSAPLTFLGAFDY